MKELVLSGEVSVPESGRWNAEQVAALTPVELADLIRDHGLGLVEQPTRFWKAATQPSTVIATASTIVAFIDEIDVDREELTVQVREMREAWTTAELNAVEDHRSALKQVRLRYQDWLTFARKRARGYGIDLFSAGLLTRGELRGYTPAPGSVAVMEPVERKPDVPVSIEPAVAVPAHAPARRTGASTAGRKPRDGWVFDSSDDTHVAVCPECHWRTISREEERMMNEAVQHAVDIHGSHTLQERLAQRARRAKKRARP